MEEQIREAVRGCGLSLNQLAKRAGITISQLSFFMRGERSLLLPAVEKLCAALGLRLVQVKKPNFS